MQILLLNINLSILALKNYTGNEAYKQANKYLHAHGLNSPVSHQLEILVFIN